jgi:hypothetical protein
MKRDIGGHRVLTFRDQLPNVVSWIRKDIVMQVNACIIYQMI